jgi:hypothetical protein
MRRARRSSRCRALNGLGEGRTDASRGLRRRAARAVPDFTRSREVGNRASVNYGSPVRAVNCGGRTRDPSRAFILRDERGTVQGAQASAVTSTSRAQVQVAQA